MAEQQPPQNYANHVRTDRFFIGYAILFFASVILAIVAVFVDDNKMLVLGALAVNGVASILAALNSRFYGLKVQDRIIRLEMRLRLAQVLPDDLKARIPDLTMGQMIALRFASDKEIPGLVHDILDKKLVKGSEVKQKIKDWQADWLRV